MIQCLSRIIKPRTLTMKSSLRSVSEFGNVVSITPRKHKSFFDQSEIVLGSQLEFIGIIDPNTVWQVKTITSSFWVHNTYVDKRIKFVRQLKDVLTLVNEETNEKRKLTFGYLKYSAAWVLIIP